MSPPAPPPRSPLLALRSPLLLGCVLTGYWALLIRQLGAQWSIYEQYNYGWAVPFLCAYLICRRLVAEGRGERGERRWQGTEVGSQKSAVTEQRVESRRQEEEISVFQDFSISAFCPNP